jgi:hypothetical protein
VAEANPDLVVRDENGQVDRALGRGERDIARMSSSRSTAR